MSLLCWLCDYGQCGHCRYTHLCFGLCPLPPPPPGRGHGHHKAVAWCRLHCPTPSQGPPPEPRARPFPHQRVPLHMTHRTAPRRITRSACPLYRGPAPASRRTVKLREDRLLSLQRGTRKHDRLLSHERRARGAPEPEEEEPVDGGPQDANVQRVRPAQPVRHEAVGLLHDVPLEGLTDHPHKPWATQGQVEGPARSQAAQRAGTRPVQSSGNHD